MTSALASIPQSALGPAGPSNTGHSSSGLQSSSTSPNGSRTMDAEAAAEQVDVVRGAKRQRRFHHRSRNGCDHCKKRRVRCDEAKPVCGNCVRKGTRDRCVFPIPSIGPRDQDEAPRRPSESPQQPGCDQPVFVDPQNLVNPFIPLPFDLAIPPSSDPPSFSFSPGIPLFQPDPSQPLDPSPNTDLFPLPSSGLFGTPEISAADDFSDIIDIPRPLIPPLATPPPLSPGTANMLDLLFGGPKTPPLPNFTWGSDEDAQGKDPAQPGESAQPQSQLWHFGHGSASGTAGTQRDASYWGMYRHTILSEAILRQTHILQQPNELAMFFPTMEQRRQFSHFLYETSNDLLVVPTAHSTNPWILHLSHLALGKASGHEILHDAFRLGLLSLASFDIGLKMRKMSPAAEYIDMYKSSAEQRESALRLLHVANVLKLSENDVFGADLVLATVTALAIRDRLAGTPDFEEPLKVGVEAVIYQGGPVAYINRYPSAGRRFLVEQIATLELLGSMTTWEAPRILSGDMTWFMFGNSEEDHLTEVYGWDRLTVAFTAAGMALAEDIKQVWILRNTYRKTSYPAIQSALTKRTAELDQRFKVMISRAADLRLETMMAPLHPRAAIGASILQACMELLLIGDWPDDDSFKGTLYPKCRAILDLCEQSVAQGMYTGLLLPLTWAAFCLESTEMDRLRNIFRTLQPHYHVDPAVMQKVIEIDWDVLLAADPADWCKVMRDNGFYMTFF